MKKALIGLVVLFTAAVAFAADCPPPKPLTCEQLAAKMAQRCLTPTPAAPKTAPPKAEPAKNGVDTPPQVVTIYVEQAPPPQKAPEPPATVYPLLGGGAVYFHGLGLQAFTGLQTAPDKHKGRWQWQIGPMWVPQNGTQAQTETCQIGCKSCALTVPGQDAKYPWGGQTSVTYVWGAK